MFPVNKQYRELIYFRAEGNLRSEAAKTYLSFLWWVLDPVLSMLIYYTVFSVILGKGEADFVPFLLIGLVTWQWFAMVVSQASNSLVVDRALVTQIRFPKIILPSVTVLIGTLKFAVVFLILMVFLFSYGYVPTATYIYLPIILACQFLLISGLSYIAALITAFIPDFNVLLPLFIRMMMFLSGIFYAVDALPEVIQQYFSLNPVATYITAYRDVLMYNQTPNLTLLSATAIASLVIYLIGVAAYKRVDSLIPRVLLQR